MNRLNKTLERMQVQVNLKRPQRFKAGADSSSAVNLVAIDVEEDVTEKSETLQIQLTIEQSFEPGDSPCKN